MGMELSPLRHYMDTVPGLFLKGVGLDVPWPRLAAMLRPAASCEDSVHSDWVKLIVAA